MSGMPPTATTNVGLAISPTGYKLRPCLTLGFE